MKSLLFSNGVKSNINLRIFKLPLKYFLNGFILVAMVWLQIFLFVQRPQNAQQLPILIAMTTAASMWYSFELNRKYIRRITQ